MRINRLLASALAAGALAALPSVATAAPDSPAERVATHLERAEDALDRAAALLERDRQGAAVSALNRSRVAIGAAQRLSDRLVGRARTDAARTAAARALQQVAQLRDENLNQLVAMLQDSDPRADRIITRALLADTAARDRAIGVLQELIDSGVAPRAEQALGRAVTALSRGRAREVGDQAEALAELSLPRPAEIALARSITENLAGQARASAVLSGLLPQLPPAAQAEVERALELLNAQLEQAARQVEAVTADLPPGVRDLVNGIVAQALAIADNPIGTLPALPAIPSLPGVPGVPGVPTIPGVPGPPGLPGGVVPNPSDLIPQLPNPNDLIPQFPGLPPGVVPTLPNPNDLIPDLSGLIPTLPGVGGPGAPLPLPLPLPIPDIGGLIGGILGGVGAGVPPAGS